MNSNAGRAAMDTPRTPAETTGRPTVRATESDAGDVAAAMDDNKASLIAEGLGLIG
jgi:hypothetical protein